MLRTVIDGQRYLSPKMTQQLVGQFIGSQDSTEADPVQRLSDRELQVFQLIGSGITTGTIARQLHLSPHDRHASRKDQTQARLEERRRTAASSNAVDAGKRLIEPERARLSEFAHTFAS